MALIDKASLLMVPSTYEEGTLYNVLPSGNRAPDSTDQNSGYDQTRADFTFDRGSNAAATRVNSDGLIEKYRENLALHSNDFSQSEWSKLTNSTYTLTTETIVDPFGISKAVYKVTLTGSGYITLRQSFTGNTNYMTASVYVKLGSSDFNLTLDQSDGDSQTATANTEWQRLSSTHASGYSFSFIDIALTGDNGDYFYVSSAQMQLGGVATDYLDSGATTAKAGVLIDLPRINFDANGENGSLLLEPQRTNLMTQSEFASLALVSNVNKTNNYGQSPEGVNNSTRLQFTANGFVGNNTQTNGTQYTLSCYAKRNDSGTQDVGFFQDGTGYVNSSWSLTSEWQRFTYTYTAANASYAGIAGISGADVSVYGFQMEAGSYATSYIPTYGTSSGVTRAADSCSVTGVSDVIGQSEGTFYWEGTLEENPSGANMQFALSDGTTSQQIKFVVSSSSTYVAAEVKNGGVQQFYNNHNIDAKTNRKYAIAYKANDFAFYIDGTQIATDTSGSVPACSKLSFDNGANANGVHGFIKNLTLFNERLSNAELAALTA